MGAFPREGSEGVGGDIIPPNQYAIPVPQGPHIYINCEGRLDEIIGRVEPAGGQVLSQKIKIEDGWIAFMQDTEGNVLGLHSS